MSGPRNEPEHRRGRARRVLRAAVVVAAVFLIALTVASVSGCCERLFYYPNATIYSKPSDRGFAFEPVDFRSADGTRLTGWFLPAVGEPKGTIIHCHGNAQNMTSHWGFVEFLPSKGFNVFVFDYRGYGRSEGKPSRRGTVEDARAAVDYVFGRADVEVDRVALFGQSLGGAIATVVAAEDERVRGLLIESAFGSYRSEAAHVLRRNPITWLFAWPLSRMLISSGYDPEDYIGSISPRPVFLIHGTADRVVPSWMSEELHEGAGEPRELWIVEGARHTAAGMLHKNEYERRVCEFFEKAFEGG